jgi:hypothetical protein
MTPALVLVRYILPAVIVLSSIVSLVLEPNETGLEGLSLLMGAGLSVALLNVLYRMGARGDAEREAEDAARTFFDQHGYWPDEAGVQ